MTDYLIAEKDLQDALSQHRSAAQALSKKKKKAPASFTADDALALERQQLRAHSIELYLATIPKVYEPEEEGGEPTTDEPWYVEVELLTAQMEMLSLIEPARTRIIELMETTIENHQKKQGIEPEDFDMEFVEPVVRGKGKQKFTVTGFGVFGLSIEYARGEERDLDWSDFDADTIREIAYEFREAMCIEMSNFE